MKAMTIKGMQPYFRMLLPLLNDFLLVSELMTEETKQKGDVYGDDDALSSLLIPLFPLISDLCVFLFFFPLYQWRR